jgi:uncharacterized protein
MHREDSCSVFTCKKHRFSMTIQPDSTSRPEIIRLVPLGLPNTVAAVHPGSGAWVLVDDAESVGLQAIAPQSGIHANLKPDHPLYSEVFAATQQYREEAGNRPASGLDTIILKLTNRCNEACRHCYDACGHDETDAEIDNLIAVVEQALMLSPSTLNILFHGGEPLLCIDAIDRISTYAVQRAHTLGKRVGLFAQTNASILNDRIISILQRHEIGLGISLDGWEELHDQMRVMLDGSGTYRLFERSYAKYKNYLLSNAGIMTTVMSTNVDKLDKVILHVQDLGFYTWDATLFDTNGAGALFPELSIKADAYCSAMEKILDLIEDGQLDNIAIKPILRRLDNLLMPQRYDMCMPGNGPCGAGGRLLSISAESTISGCDILHDPALIFGKFPLMTLADAQSSPNVGKILARPAQLHGCNHCTWFGVCGGTCLARSTLTSPNSVDCQVSKHINPSLLKRIANSDKLLNWYERFPLWRRRACIIAMDAPTKLRSENEFSSNFIKTPSPSLVRNSRIPIYPLKEIP